MHARIRTIVRTLAQRTHRNGIEAEIVFKKFCVLVKDCPCDGEGVDLAFRTNGMSCAFSKPLAGHLHSTHKQLHRSKSRIVPCSVGHLVSSSSLNSHAVRAPGRR